MKTLLILMLLGVGLIAVGCGDQSRADGDAFAEVDSDTDGDAARDGDSDPDGVTGVDGDTNPDGDLEEDGYRDAPDGEPVDGDDAESEMEDDADPDQEPDPDPDAEPSPVDCSPIASHSGWELCRSSATTCEAVFSDRAGCAVVCTEAGLVCAHVFENVDDRCEPDITRPELTCDPPSGHGSDYCVCVRPGCRGSCEGRQCGDDGCGGRCGECADGLECRDHRCMPREVDCSRYPYDPPALLAELVGFGQGTTGGDPARVYHVTTQDDDGPGSLRAALESGEPFWIVFDVEGEFRFDFEDKVEVRSDKTVDGRGREVRILNAQFAINPGVSNLIFTDLDLSFTDPEDGLGDVFGLRGHAAASADDYDTHHFWFHHLNLHLAGDGLIDVRGATRITISWSHFYDHTKVMLHTKDTDDNPSPGLEITYHHNWFDTVTRRSPHFAYGKADFYNNWHYHWYEYGAASIDEAQFLSEGNIYEAREGWVCLIPCPDPSPHGGGNDLLVSKKALVNDWAVDRTVGFTRSVGDWLLNDASVAVHQPDRVFERRDYYPADPETADNSLRQRIQTGAGPRIGYCRGR